MQVRGNILFILTLAVIVITGLTTFFLSGKKPDEYKPGIDAEIDKAVNQAKSVYREKKALGYDFAEGPCLTNDLTRDWVADIVHNPRQSLDDLPQNQCQAYKEGRAKHFVELDPEGNLVKVK